MVDELGAAFRRVRLDRAVRSALASPDDPLPKELVDALLKDWGDGSLSADDRHVTTLLAEASSASGPVLQCGANVLTLIAGIACHRSRTHLWVLEHNLHWANVLRSRIEHYGIANTHVVVAPIEVADGRLWYAIDKARLPDGIAVVVCEGSSVEASGVLNAIENLESKLTPRGVILGRNVRKSGELKRIAKWARAHDAVLLSSGKDDSSMKIALPDPSRPDAASRLNTVYDDKTYVRGGR